MEFFKSEQKIIFRTKEFNQFNDVSVFIIPYIGAVELKVKTFEKENDGIGAYEFQGMRGFDHGKDFISVTEITVINDIEGKQIIEDKINAAIHEGNFEVIVEEN